MSAEQRSIVGYAAVFRWTPTDGTGVPASVGTVTVDITDISEATVITGGATSGTGTGERSYSLAATSCTRPELFEATWKVSGVAVATTLLEVVGGVIATVAEIRANEPKLSAGPWTDAQLLRASWETTDEFERFCRVAFTPRVRREYRLQAAPYSSARLQLGCAELREVRAAAYLLSGSDTSTAFTADAIGSILPDPYGAAMFTDSTVFPASSTIDITYEHGHTRPSADLVRAFTRRVTERIMLPGSGLPGRATSTQAPEGLTVFLARVDEDHPTGNGDIDAVLRGERSRRAVSIL